jgi:hypothetical protein
MPKGMEVKGERNAILIRRQINRKALGAVLDTEKS